MCMSNLWKDWRNQLTQALQYPNFRNRGYAMADSICHVQIYKHINGSKKLLPTFLSSKDDETAPLRPQLVTAAEIPKMFCAEVFVSGPPIEVPRFTKLLQGQNAGLPEDLWHLRYQQATDQGKIIVWSTDKDSANALKAIGDRPHFGSSHLRVPVLVAAVQHTAQMSRNNTHRPPECMWSLTAPTRCHGRCSRCLL